MSAFEIFNVFTLREWPIIMYSVFAGLGLSLFILFHSERLSNPCCISKTSFSILSDAIVTLVSSAIVDIRCASKLFQVKTSSFCLEVDTNLSFQG